MLDDQLMFGDGLVYLMPFVVFISTFSIFFGLFHVCFSLTFYFLWVLFGVLIFYFSWASACKTIEFHGIISCNFLHNHAFLHSFFSNQNLAK